MKEYTPEEKQAVQDSFLTLWSIHHPNKEMPAPTQKAYFLALQDLGVDGIKQACLMAMVEFEWMPKPKQLRELRFGNIEQQAESAWAQVVYAIEQHGGYASVEFDDSRISNAIQNCGGWQHFCEKQETWAKKEFISAFKNFPADCQPVRCIGIHDKNNRRYTPKLIGFEGQPRLCRDSTNEVREMAKQLSISMEVV